jgi:hypothetical protein
MALPRQMKSIAFSETGNVPSNADCQVGVGQIHTNASEGSNWGSGRDVGRAIGHLRVAAELTKAGGSARPTAQAFRGLESPGNY